jgi:hypothetical protein
MPPKLNKAQCEDVALIMTPGENAIRLRGGGDKSLLDFLTANASHDISEIVNSVVDKGCTWPRDAIISYFRCVYLNSVFSDYKWVDRGLARRFALDDPAELQTFTSLHVRFELALEGDPDQGDRDGHYPNVWEVLRALAARDIRLAKRFAQRGAYPLSLSSHFHTIYNGVFALLQDDWDTFKSLEKRFAPKSAPKWLQAMCACLHGILHERPSQIEAAIATMLASYPRTDQICAIRKTVCFEAHGFYALCHLVNPVLVAEVNTERKLPWDADLCSLAFAKPEPFELDFDLTFVSQAFHDVIIGLKKAAWWGCGPMVASVPAK